MGFAGRVGYWMQCMTSFQDLVESRKAWISESLIPWCRQASLVDLRKAAEEWGDIAGRVDPEFSLWLWAWSRFPALYVDGLRGLEETFEVAVRLRDGRVLRGFPDARQSRRGMLVVQGQEGRWARSRSMTSSRSSAPDIATPHVRTVLKSDRVPPLASHTPTIDCKTLPATFPP